jgi:nicotinamidase-related amidase
MTLSTLDPTPALVVIDLQKGVLALPTVHPATEIVERSARLAAAFRRRGLPVVLVNATGRAPGGTEAHPSLRTPTADAADLVEGLGAQPGDLRISKQTWGAFHNTSLDADLQAQGVTQVLVTGVATSAGVESTARAAHEHGYDVVLVTDAMTDMDADNHEHSLRKIFPRIGETTTTDEVLEMLGG